MIAFLKFLVGFLLLLSSFVLLFVCSPNKFEFNSSYFLGLFQSNFVQGFTGSALLAVWLIWFGWLFDVIGKFVRSMKLLDKPHKKNSDLWKEGKDIKAHAVCCPGAQSDKTKTYVTDVCLFFECLDETIRDELNRSTITWKKNGKAINNNPYAFSIKLLYFTTEMPADRQAVLDKYFNFIRKCVRCDYKEVSDSKKSFDIESENYSLKIVRCDKDGGKTTVHKVIVTEIRNDNHKILMQELLHAKKLP